jgi:integrase
MGRKSRIEMHREYMGATGLTFSHGADGCKFSVVRPQRNSAVAFKFSDLDGRVLTIERGVSGEQVGPTKTKRTRRLTLGRTTVELWRASERTWRGRGECASLGEWVFLPDIDHQRRLTASGMGHWFAELCAEADLAGVSLHRLRHSVATFLVGRGELLRAQQRLGHRDASTTLRNYAHALPLGWRTAGPLTISTPCWVHL